MKLFTNLISWILQLGVAVLLGSAVYAKFTGAEESIAMFTELGMEPQGRFLIGGLEALAVLLLLIPPSVNYGAGLAASLMTGALIAHATVIGFQGPNFSLGMMAVGAFVGSLLILYFRRANTATIHRMFGSH